MKRSQEISPDAILPEGVVTKMKEILKCEDTGRPIVITVVLRGSAEPAWSVFAR